MLNLNCLQSLVIKVLISWFLNDLGKPNDPIVEMTKMKYQKSLTELWLL